MFGRDGLKKFLVDVHEAWCEKVEKCYEDQSQQQLRQLTSQFSHQSIRKIQKHHGPATTLELSSLSAANVPAAEIPADNGASSSSTLHQAGNGTSQNLLSIDLWKAFEDGIAFAHADSLASLPAPKEPPRIETAMESHLNITVTPKKCLAKHNEKGKDISEYTWDKCKEEIENELADLAI